MAHRKTTREQAVVLLKEIDRAGVLSASAYTDLGDMTGDDLIRQNRRETETGRWQAFSARHHAQRAIMLLAEEDDPVGAAESLIYAQRLWIEALSACQHANKVSRLQALPKPSGRPTDPMRARLYDLASPLVAQGEPVTQAVCAAVRLDAALKAWAKGLQPSALAKTYRREAKARGGMGS